MELHRIGEEKLKVLLTPFDMMKYGLTVEKLDYENTETRKAIWAILDHAKHETGFDAARGRLCIEVFPEKNGGCAIYITKMPKSELVGGDLPSIVGEETPSALWCFEAAEDLLSACAMLRDGGYSLPSGAFYEEKETGARYYLALSIPESTKKRPVVGPFRMEEFGRRLEGEHSLSYLLEHARDLCSAHAVETLAPLANSAKFAEKNPK